MTDIWRGGCTALLAPLLGELSAKLTEGSPEWRLEQGGKREGRPKTTMYAGRHGGRPLHKEFGLCTDLKMLLCASNKS